MAVITAATTAQLLSGTYSVSSYSWNHWNRTWTINSACTTGGNTCISTWGEWLLTGTSTVNTAVWTHWAARGRVQLLDLEAMAAPPVRVQQPRSRAEVSAANIRAEDLLRRHLTPEQARDLDEKNCFYLKVYGKDGVEREYRIDRGTHGNVKLLNKKRSVVGSYCVQPDHVPAADAMLAQKLWLETDEEAFKRVANFRAHG